MLADRFDRRPGHPGGARDMGADDVDAGTVTRSGRDASCRTDGHRHAVCASTNDGGGGGQCVDGSVPVSGYGQTQTVDAITCASEPAAMTCADSSTGHYFRISREAYEVG
ncbi:MAG: hypothetical protein JWR34_4583 [Mycobacterium sp.]|jgi:hypothetical protein|nr:hypothetical protein [Mycobacterium sp.]